ncbi:MAG: hypothetical protein M3680_16475 [Myxococcota bacterium]|nr:hypothetical protein [Myxococcota bacterium]
MTAAPSGLGWLAITAILAVVVVVTLGLGPGCVDDAGPRLDAVTPAAAAPGAVVSLEGRRLCGASGDCAAAGGAIRIGLDMPVQATIIMYSNTTAQIRIPTITPLGRTQLVVTVNEQASNALAFEVLAP